MATIGELLKQTPEQLQELLDKARLVGEEARTQRVASEAPLEAAKGAASRSARDADYARIFEKPLREAELEEVFKDKLDDVVPDRRKVAVEKLAKGAAGTTNQGVIELPDPQIRKTAALKKLAKEAAGTTNQGVIELPAPKGSTFDELLKSRSKSISPALKQLLGGAGKTALNIGSKIAKIAGPIGVVAGLYGDELPADEESPFGRQLTPEEMESSLVPGAKLNYRPESKEKSDLYPPNDPIESNSLAAIISEVSKLPKRNVSRFEQSALDDINSRSDLVDVEKDRMRGQIAGLYDRQTTDNSNVGGGDSHLNKTTAKTAGVPVPADIPVATPLPAAALPPSISEKSTEQDEIANILKGDTGNKYEELLRQYKETEKAQRSGQRMALLGEASEKLGAAIAGAKAPTDDYFQRLAKQIPGTKEFKEEKEFEKEAKRNDANSEESRSARELLKTQGISLPETVTAAFIEKNYPQFANILNRREAAKDRASRERDRKLDRDDEKAKDKKNEDDRFILGGLDRLTKDQTYNVRLKVGRGKKLIEEAIKNPSSFGDISSLYSAITALDPDSMVKEGEIKLAREGLSLGESIIKQVTRIGANPRLLNSRLLGDINKYVNIIDKQTEESYGMKRDALFEQAETRNIPSKDYKRMDPFSVRELKQPPATQTKKSATPLSEKLTGMAGTTFTVKSGPHVGKIFEVNADETSATEL